MIDVTPAAKIAMTRHAERTRHRCLRLFLDETDCSDGGLSIGEDHVRTNDRVFGYDGFDLVVENNLLGHAEPVRVDFQEGGFLIESAMRSDETCVACCGCC